MWWLSFIGGSVVIMEAASLSHARLLAALKNLGRASQFADGYFITPDLAAMIPDNSIGRMLSSDEARRLLKLLKYGPQEYGAKPSRQPAIVPSRLRA
jgi:hypothetical protein